MGITSWGIGCGEAGLPGVYTNVTESLCFIDFATRCAFGQDVDKFGIRNCQKWAETKYCEAKETLKKITNEVCISFEGQYVNHVPILQNVSLFFNR